MRRRTAAVRALVSRDQWQAAARKWHTDYPARGEVAEPGLRRTPGERVTSEGFRGFKSPPLRQSVFNFWHCLESRAKYPRVGSRASQGDRRVAQRSLCRKFGRISLCAAVIRFPSQNEAIGEFRSTALRHAYMDPARVKG